MCCYAINEGYEISCMFDNDKAHAGHGLTFLLWTPAGTRVRTGDDDGAVRVWKAGQRGALVAPPFKVRATRSFTLSFYY